MVSANYTEAMKAIIGCLIIENKTAPEILGTIHPFHFADDTLRQLYIKAGELYAKGKLDRLIYLLNTPQYRAFITDIIDTTPTAANYKEYMELLLNEYALYTARQTAIEIPKLADYADLGKIEESIDKLKGIISAQGTDVLPDMTAVYGDFLDMLDTTPDYIKLGFESLDSRLYIKKGSYVVIGARPSLGKTALALNMADEISKSRKTIFFSLETGLSTLYERYFTAALDLDFKMIMDRTLTEDDWRDIGSKYPQIKERKLRFCEAGGLTVREICSRALKEQAEVIFIDYLGLVNGEGKSEYERVSHVSKYLHTFAQKYKITVIVLSQLNRDTVWNDRPDMSNLRDSGQVEQDADVIMLLHKPLGSDPLREVIIAKNKEGQTGDAVLDFDGTRQKFLETERANLAIKKADKPVDKRLVPYNLSERARQMNMMQ